MNAAPCEIYGRVNAVEAPSPREKMHFSARILRALLRPPGRFFHALTFIAVGFTLWALALHGILPFLGWISLGVIFGWMAAGSAWIVRFLTRLAVWIFAPATRQTPRPGARGFLVLPACLVVLFLLNLGNVPLRIAFYLSQPALEQVPSAAWTASSSSRVKNVAEVIYHLKNAPRVGLYRTKRVDVRGPNVRIEVTDNAFLWSGTKAGFAKCPGGCKANQFPPAYMRGEEPKYIQLSRDWFWWEESGTDD